MTSFSRFFCAFALALLLVGASHGQKPQAVIDIENEFFACRASTVAAENACTAWYNACTEHRNDAYSDLSYFESRLTQGQYEQMDERLEDADLASYNPAKDEMNWANGQWMNATSGVLFFTQLANMAESMQQWNLAIYYFQQAIDLQASMTSAYLHAKSLFLGVDAEYQSVDAQIIEWANP